MYPKITDYRENYVLPTVKETGSIHLGLGFMLYSSNADKDIRSLNNATAQFWSILTALTINKLHQIIDDAGLTDSIKVISTIYDSIYIEMDDDLDLIWELNKIIVDIMTTDYVTPIKVKNEANLEIGYDWANLKELPNNATKEEIAAIHTSLRRS